MKWKIIDDKNIADIMIKVSANSEEVLFSNILEAFTEVITKISRVKAEKDISIKITGKNLSELVSNFINKLIYLKDTDFLIFRRGEFKLMFTREGYTLFALLSGQKIKKNLSIKTDIKALARHKFKVEKIRNKYKVSLVYDV